MSARSPFPPAYFATIAEAETRHWWFRARNRVLLWALQRQAGRFANLLEVGCGTGQVLEAVSRAYPHVALEGAEYHEEGLAFARQRLPHAAFRQLDATTMQESGRYDVIGAFDVIEHIEADELVLRNLTRALKPQGTLMVTVPQHRWLWSKADEHACHVRRYTRHELLAKVRAAGLQPMLVTSFVSLLLPLMWLSRLRMKSGDYDQMDEFRISPWLNRALEGVMKLELGLMKAGLRFPFGGSLLVVARKAP